MTHETYGIAGPDDIIATIPGEVLDWLLVLGIDTLREGWHGLDDDVAARYVDVLAAVNADVQMDAEAYAEDAEQTEAWADYRALVTAIGPGFHPDTRGEDYTSLPDGYTPDRVDAIVDRAFALNLDVYGGVLDLFNQWRAEAEAARK
jgi:hypothetical protein